MEDQKETLKCHYCEQNMRYSDAHSHAEWDRMKSRGECMVCFLLNAMGDANLRARRIVMHP